MCSGASVVAANGTFSITSYAGARRPTMIFEGLITDSDACETALVAAGWNMIKVELPCMGTDQQPGEAFGLVGWANRILAGRNVQNEWSARVGAILDMLLKQGRIRGDKLYAQGTSRGGWLAAYLASQYSGYAGARIRGVGLFAPVTTLNYGGLFEFAAIPPATLNPWDLVNIAPTLLTKIGWNTITNTDARVGTANDVAFAATTPNIHFEIDTHTVGHDTSAFEYALAASLLIADAASFP